MSETRTNSTSPNGNVNGPRKSYTGSNDPPAHFGENFVATIHADTYEAINPAQWNMQDKVVVISGASKGIGRAVALSFAKARAGTIVICSRSSKGLDDVEEEIFIQQAASQRINAHSLTNTIATRVLKCVIDITDASSVRQTAERILSETGRVDVLVNNAAHLETYRPIAETDPEEWWETWNVNIKGTYLMTRALLPILLESTSKGGLRTIVNVASIGAHRYVAGASAYHTSKLALLRFNEFIHLEYGTKGIITIAVHPGAVPTEGIGMKLPPERQKLLIDKAALPGDCIVWLANERREWLSGRYVSCNWDVKELEEKKGEILEGDKLRVKMVV